MMMAKSIKFTNDTYLDSSSIVKGKKSLNNFLFTKCQEHWIDATDVDDFLSKFQQLEGYKIHMGWANIGSAYAFFGFYQTYNNGYGKVLLMSAWKTYLCTLNNGTWSIGEISII